MDTPDEEGKVSRHYEQALRLMADHRDTLSPVTMRDIARLLVRCCDGEKCAAHFLMDNTIVGEDPHLRFHWLLTKSCVPRCMPRDRGLWRQLQAVKSEHGTE